MVDEQQLQTWANAPGSSKAQSTYNSIKTALSQSNSSRVKGAEIYLQGSYANSTNVRVDSDIDVVVQLNSTFYYDISKLTSFEKSLFELAFSDSTYNWSDFRNDIIIALQNYFGSTYVKPGNKSIKLIGNDQRLNADVVPCLQHRKYNTFGIDRHYDFIEGMKFWTILDNKVIINYPKAHKDNGEDKNASHRTDEMYKNLVRIVKNVRKQIVENHNFNPKLAPSYFVECAIYNAPDDHFHTDYQTTLSNVLNFVLRTCNADNLFTVSHQHLLFGLEPWQWNKTNAGIFFQTVEDYFQNGRI